MYSSTKMRNMNLVVAIENRLHSMLSVEHCPEQSQNLLSLAFIISKFKMISNDPKRTISTRAIGKRTRTATLLKTSENDDLGIVFRNIANVGVVLGKLKGRVKEETCMMCGLKVLEVNGCHIDSASQATLLVQSVEAGETVTIVADGISVRATKKKWAKPGIKLVNIKNGVKITQVDNDGCFPSLRPGQILTSINGKVVITSDVAMGTLKQSKDLELIVLGEDDDSSETSWTAPSVTYTSTSSVANELELLEPIHFQMQDFDDDEI